MKKLLFAFFALLLASSATMAQTKPSQQKPATKAKTVVIPNKSEKPALKVVKASKDQALPGAKQKTTKESDPAASLFEATKAN